MRLRTRLLGGTLLLVVALGAALIVLMRMTLASRLEQELQRRVVSIAKFVAEDSTKLLLTENIVGLQLLVERSRRVESDIAYVFVQDPSGAVVVHTFGDTFPVGLLDVNAPETAGTPRVRKLVTGSGPMYDVAISVGSDRQGHDLGRVRVGILATSIDRGVAAVLYSGAGITAACLLIFWVVAFAVDLAISSKIELLSEGTRAIGLGDLEYRIPVSGGGEFADLARAFNDMADNLLRSEAKLVDLNTALMREVRDRTAAEASIRRGLERYELLFGSVSDAVYVHELGENGQPGRIVEVNDVGLARLGYTREEMLGMTIGQVDAPGTDGTDSAQVIERLRGGETVVFERVHAARSGQLVPVEVSSRLFKLDGRSLVLSLCRDISERKLAESELRRAGEELARQNEELKQMDRLREGFIRDVSHELKTPVAKQAMQLEILRGIAEREGFSAAVAKVVAVMESSVRRQQQVIRNLLGLARLESGVRAYRREPVQLDQVVRGVLDDYQPEMDARGIVLRADLAPVHITSDNEMLWHVFSNLVNNAIKFQRDPAAGHIEVVLEVDERSAVVRVRDEGIGLTPEELAKVFDKFYQATASAEGSGVGLTICRMIVEGVGGKIEFQSAGKGRGTTAVVRLPLGEGKVPT